MVELGDDLTRYLADRDAPDLSALESSDQFEQVGAYLLATYMRLGSITASNLAKRHNPETLGEIDKALKHLASQIDIDVDLASRHPGVSAMGMQRLLETFRAYAGDVENLLPAEVASVDSYDRFVAIMGRIHTYLFPAFGPENVNRLYALVVTNWLQGLSLAAMIWKNIEWHQRVSARSGFPR